MNIKEEFEFGAFLKSSNIDGLKTLLDQRILVINNIEESRQKIKEVEKKIKDYETELTRLNKKIGEGMEKVEAGWKEWRERYFDNGEKTNGDDKKTS